MSDLQPRIQRAKELLRTVRHAAMATVNENGTPHNTPFLLIWSAELDSIYWSSHPDSLHSKNIERTGNIFVVLYEAQQGGGLYIEAKNAHQVSDSELDGALSLHNNIRTDKGKDPLPLSFYTNDSPQRMYKATTTKFYINIAELNSDGVIIKDVRHEIGTEVLLT